MLLDLELLSSFSTFSFCFVMRADQLRGGPGGCRSAATPAAPARPAAASRSRADALGPSPASAACPRARAIPCRAPTAPTTIGDALEVPLNWSVYQMSSFAPPWRSPYPAVVTSRPQPCASTSAAEVREVEPRAVGAVVAAVRAGRRRSCADDDRAGVAVRPVERVRPRRRGSRGPGCCRARRRGSRRRCRPPRRR